MSIAAIFDGDDTLWELQPIYDRAMDAFSQVLSKEFEISPEIIRYELLQIDAAHVEKLGFGERRFLHSMLLLYERFCVEQGRRESAEIKSKISEMAVTVSTVFPKPMEGAQDVLEDLYGRHCLILYSGGTKTIQLQRLKNLGFDRFFTAVYFCETKTAFDLKKILWEQHLVPEITWMVGNSPKSDINPALSLGLNCIWLKSASWVYDKEAFADRRVHKITSLREIPGILSRKA
jgi:putative hydrolase of the HAD superfamily